MDAKETFRGMTREEMAKEIRETYERIVRNHGTPRDPMYNVKKFLDRVEEEGKKRPPKHF